jgi:hypothetical protein
MGENMKYLALAIIAMSLLGNTAEANRANKRQSNQKSRIHQGVKSGELTKREAHKLRKQQRGIERQEERANADGEVTAKEAAKLEQRQDRASKAIYKQKHDAQERKQSNNDESAGDQAE